ncbi:MULTISPECIES: CPBP family intramembrane glutamic endopeptidase [Micrococcaceae]|uniref:CPBP family intramembrane glutamic endopeptidase n=2 Tax=Micrococcales TaxID=85006 RepID=UPI000D4D8806|nr:MULTISPECIES: CPBP family intramembrane glutamic endopeptidase [unclassified Arthrobacter]PRB78420.1 CPBP family intramembrane metalloprotease domain-containing protein [Arthrobacter sp. MYb214]
MLSIVCFCVLSVVLAWAVALPLWMGEGINDAKLPGIAMAMMFTPTIAALVIAIVERRLTSFTSEVGLWPIKRPGKFAIALVLSYVIPLGLILQAPFIGTWLGVFPGDLQNFTVLRVVSGQEGPTIYLLGQAGLIVVAGLMNSLFALGEEIGWRGWLWIRLQPYGQLVSILVSGVVWGIWHAPLVLLGYNYPMATGAWGVMAMCGMCTVFGAFLGWLRTYSDSVWPAALAHGAFNASVGLVSLFMVMGVPLDATKASIMGWSGWILPGIVIAAMLLKGAFKPQWAKDLSTGR